jgi:hypothetical protein
MILPELRFWRSRSAVDYSGKGNIKLLPADIYAEIVPSRHESKQIRDELDSLSGLGS